MVRSAERTPDVARRASGNDVHSLTKIYNILITIIQTSNRPTHKGKKKKTKPKTATHTPPADSSSASRRLPLRATSSSGIASPYTPTVVRTLTSSGRPPMLMRRPVLANPPELTASVAARDDEYVVCTRMITLTG